jgi:hypothetical protein
VSSLSPVCKTTSWSRYRVPYIAGLALDIITQQIKHGGRATASKLLERGAAAAVVEAMRNSPYIYVRSAAVDVFLEMCKQLKSTAVGAFLEADLLGAIASVSTGTGGRSTCDRGHGGWRCL